MELMSLHIREVPQEEDNQKKDNKNFNLETIKELFNTLANN